MKSIFRVVFYLRSNYVNKEGKMPVMQRIYLNNERLSIGFTGIAVKLPQWDKEKERLKERNTEVLNFYFTQPILDIKVTEHITIIETKNGVNQFF